VIRVSVCTVCVPAPPVNSLVWYPRHRSDALRARSTRPGAPLPPSLMSLFYTFYRYVIQINTKAINVLQMWVRNTMIACMQLWVPRFGRVKDEEIRRTVFGHLRSA
jgi:hypothetical protein